MNTSSVLVDSSTRCHHNMSSWEERMEKMYTYFYLVIFIPGLLLNTTALWVLCRHIRKKTKAVIFMMNLAFADLAHILSLPLRIYYYFTHTWPFGHPMCLLCFYLKYLNMYAAIVFLVCISVQRCVFLLDPFAARRWRRRYDLLISMTVWVVVGLACSPFIVMRLSNSPTSTGVSTQQVYNTSYSAGATSTRHPLVHTQRYGTSFSTSHITNASTNVGCFKDLPMRRLPLSLAVTMMALAELFGFLIPLACISYSSFKIARSLMQDPTQEQGSVTLSNSTTVRTRMQSVTSTCQTDKYHEKQTNGEKRRALRMVLSCSILFLLCFAPYHLNFMLYLMVSQDVLSHCATRLAVRQFHPVSLCLASLSCCFNPLLYYFVTAEFRLHLTRRTSSFSSFLSSPVSSPTQHTFMHRLMSMESSSSERE